MSETITTESMTSTEQRGVAGVLDSGGIHWVGDGFRVAQVFPAAHDLGEKISPFLLMDYHAPYDYTPTDKPRGVGVHPHRGFETVTLAFEGSVAHHDSTGAGGVIGPGDVQWMTAASGILHKEYHEAEWAKVGGRMHMMQLWVNLPAKHKLDPPGYQPLVASDMGVDDVDGGEVHVFAGEFAGVKGPARTHTKINLWRFKLHGGGRFEFDVDPSENVAIFVMDGSVEANGARAGAQQLLLFENRGRHIEVEAADGAHALVLSGTPLGEPVYSYGPFVMNTRHEIVEAFEAFDRGDFGHLE